MFSKHWRLGIDIDVLFVCVCDNPAALYEIKCVFVFLLLEQY